MARERPDEPANRHQSKLQQLQGADETWWARQATLSMARQLSSALACCAILHPHTSATSAASSFLRRACSAFGNSKNNRHVKSDVCRQRPSHRSQRRTRPAIGMPSWGSVGATAARGTSSARSDARSNISRWHVHLAPRRTFLRRSPFQASPGSGTIEPFRPQQPATDTEPIHEPSSTATGHVSGGPRSPLP